MVHSFHHLALVIHPCFAGARPHRLSSRAAAASSPQCLGYGPLSGLCSLPGTRVALREFAELWDLCRFLAEAAVVAYRNDAPQRRLFLLYPDGPEERSLTLPPGTLDVPSIRAIVLASMLSPDRRLSITIDAIAGPVRVLLLAVDGQFAPTDGTSLAATDKNKPHRCKASSLGWVQPGDQQFIVINPTNAKVCLKIRVMDAGE